LFNFQGTLCARLIGGSFVIIAKLFEFVKSFFPIHWNLFSGSFSARSFAFRLSSFAIVADLLEFVKSFFPIRRNLFSSSV